MELGLTLWQGVYADMPGLWLRWVERNGVLLATGLEAKTQERQRADDERRLADDERRRAELLARKLRELGLDPDAIAPGAARG